jgi:hypothetical protein
VGTTSHVLSNGQEVWLSTFTGEVLDQSTTTSTTITQDAPTVLSSKSVIPGQIRSETHTAQQIWLRGADGTERAIALSDLVLASRVGHTVSVLWGSTAGNDRGSYFASRNHTTGEIHSDVLALGSELRRWHLNVGASSSLLTWTAVFAVIAALLAFALTGGRFENRLAMALGGVVAGALVGLAVWALLGSSLGPERRAKQLTQEIDSLATQRLSSLT